MISPKHKHTQPKHSIDLRTRKAQPDNNISVNNVNLTNKN
ncbi:hypothetical protein Pint_34126 [Pistacia integerrima]|uniref:Uncharacterized protein n=1 Tax=Pistacia integerrima TaxID=434235 RepID=A0ACC0X828_9ROSI|nr:hypothetical protein Pint_34126 [Pistacia integerrima]